MTVAAPAGLRLRDYAGESDLPEIVRVLNAEAAAFGIDEVWPEAGLRSWFAHPTDHFDPARDVVIGELDGRTMAAGWLEWIDTRDGLHREFRHRGSVDPAFSGRGIGTALLAELEERSRRLSADRPSDREPVMLSFAAAGRRSQTFLAANGYTVVRWYLDMVRTNLDEVDVPPMPDGLEMRTVRPDQHVAIWRANREAFRDHWGGADESLDVLERILDDPDTDTSLWLIAWDGDEIAGGVWNEIRPAENEALGLRRGWLGSVFTRRAWRRRGLAGALIGRSLLALRERGMTSAILGVDAENPSGALGLYEAAGFAVHDRFAAMRKPIASVRQGHW